MKRLVTILGICALTVPVMAGRAYGASVEKTCTALQAFTDAGATVDPADRLATGRAHLRDAQRAADKSGDRQLAKMTRRFRAAFAVAVKHPDKRSANLLLNETGTKLWVYCADNGFPIRRTAPTTTTTTALPPETG